MRRVEHAADGAGKSVHGPQSRVGQGQRHQVLGFELAQTSLKRFLLAKGLALVGPGDTILVPAPAFPVHIYAAIIAGGSVIRVSLDEPEIFLNRIKRMCENILPRPRLLILNYPHNPTAELATVGFF